MKTPELRSNKLIRVQRTQYNIINMWVVILVCFIINAIKHIQSEINIGNNNNTNLEYTFYRSRLIHFIHNIIVMVYVTTFYNVRVPDKSASQPNAGIPSL